MRRQFFRIYVGIAGLLLAGVIGFLILSRQWLEVVREWQLEEQTHALVVAIREELSGVGENTSDRLLVLNLFSLTHRVPLWLEPMTTAPLSSGEKELILSGGILTVEEELGLLTTYAVASPGEVIVLGPYMPGQMMQWQDMFDEDRGPPGPRDGGFREGSPDLERFSGRFGRGPRGGWPPRPPEGELLFGPEYFFLGILIISILIIGTAIYLLIRPVERRIYGLSDVAQKFGEGDLAIRAEAYQDDAIAALASRFNWMADRIEGQVEGQRELLRAVSHELRTPLARLYFLIHRLEKAGSTVEKDQFVPKIENSLTELNELVEELLSFARVEGNLKVSDLEEIDLQVEVTKIVEMAEELREGILVDCSLEAQRLVAIPRYFRRALTNLVSNAVRHAKSQIQISCTQVGDVVRVSVEDDGPGIPSDVIGKIFEPFFQVEESRSRHGGVGLGLAIVERIMNLHGGRVEVSSLESGARFTLCFSQSSYAEVCLEEDLVDATIS